MTDLISRQAAIDALGEEPEVWTGNDEYAQGLNNQWHYDVTALKAVPSAPQWIPCSERLPCEDGRYLVSYWLMKDMPWISVMYYGKPTFPEKDHPCFYVSDGEYGDVEYNDIVAWMPLPEPFRKDEEKGEAE